MAQALLTKEQPIKRVSLDVGYGSQPAFAREFKENPAHRRNPGSRSSPASMHYEVMNDFAPIEEPWPCENNAVWRLSDRLGCLRESASIKPFSGTTSNHIHRISRRL
ncbi:hypothetical protein [Noviherbaspirillum sp.]|uniref:hypothetical protein n=1 Tax=Noviherbaspirillum sp. TaxID=1926288 RepID=UPI002FE15CEF